MDRAHVSQFQGYFLHLFINNVEPEAETEGPYFDFLIFGRAWKDLCDAFVEASAFRGDWLPSIQLIFPPMDSQITSWKAPIDTPFAAKTQTSFLQTFQTSLRYLAHTSILGAVDTQAAAAVVAKAEPTEWLEPNEYVDYLLEVTRRGDHYFDEKAHVKAYQEWTFVSRNIARAWASSWWATLTQEGGMEFKDRILEIYFTSHDKLATNQVRILGHFKQPRLCIFISVYELVAERLARHDPALGVTLAMLSRYATNGIVVGTDTQQYERH